MSYPLPNLMDRRWQYSLCRKMILKPAMRTALSVTILDFIYQLYYGELTIALHSP